MKILKDLASNSDLMAFLSFIVVVAATVKFLLEGVVIHTGSHVFSFGHIDSLTYTAFLAPILGTHGFIKSRKRRLEDENTSKVDNPDAN